MVGTEVSWHPVNAPVRSGAVGTMWSTRSGRCAFVDSVIESRRARIVQPSAIWDGDPMPSTMLKRSIVTISALARKWLEYPRRELLIVRTAPGYTILAFRHHLDNPHRSSPGAASHRVCPSALHRHRNHPGRCARRIEQKWVKPLAATPSRLPAGHTLIGFQ